MPKYRITIHFELLHTEIEAESAEEAEQQFYETHEPDHFGQPICYVEVHRAQPSAEDAGLNRLLDLLAGKKPGGR